MEPTARRLEQLLVAPGTRANLAERDPGWGGDYEGLSKTDARALLAVEVDALSEAQELLWASHTHALLVVLQGMDASGKDSVIEHVLSGVNPQGVRVVSFKQPSPEELEHDFLWRVSKALPGHGHIGVFNRSHYEEVVVVRVHPEWLAKQGVPDTAVGPRFWDHRHGDINAFERHLDRSGTKIVKLFLHVSRAKQRQRFLKRLDNPEKHWKFRAADVAERARWDEYTTAYEEALSATSTPWAPWHVVPADRKPLTHLFVATILVDAIRGLDLRWPEVSAEDREANAEARRRLETESSSQNL